MNEKTFLICLAAFLHLNAPLVAMTVRELFHWWGKR